MCRGAANGCVPDNLHDYVHGNCWTASAKGAQCYSNSGCASHICMRPVATTTVKYPEGVCQ